MKIQKTYSYLTDTDRILVSKGLAEISVHSIRFDRYYTESEKDQNMEVSELMSKEEYSEYCKQVSEVFRGKMKGILAEFVDKYDIHQGSEETSTLEHFRSDWDLFYNTNENGDFFTLFFNGKRTPAANLKLLDELLAMIEQMHVDHVCCIVQYTAVKHVKELNERAKEVFARLENTWVTYHGNTGKIRIIGEQDDYILFGFFKKGARVNYRKVPVEELVTMEESKSAGPGVIVLKNAGWKEIHYQKREFNRIDGKGMLSFPVKNGKPVFQSDAAKKNYEYALTHPEEYRDVGVIPYIEKYWENTFILCKCGNELELHNELHGACSCPNCGTWYNLFGQELLPPEEWYEEVGI